MSYCWTGLPFFGITKQTLMHVQWDGGQTVKTLSALILALAQPSGVQRFCGKECAGPWHHVWTLFCFYRCVKYYTTFGSWNPPSQCVMFPVCPISWMISFAPLLLIELYWVSPHYAQWKAGMHKRFQSSRTNVSVASKINIFCWQILLCYLLFLCNRCMKDWKNHTYI